MFRSGEARVVRAGAQALIAVTLAAGVFIAADASTAGALTVTPVCDAYSADTNGQPTGAPLATGVELPGLNLPDLGNKTVETGTAFEAKTTSSSTSLPGSTQIEFPAGSGTMLDATVNEVKNIVMKFKTTGAASIGTPALSGGNVLSATATVNASDVLTFTLPGKVNGSTIGGGSAYFPGGESFTAPELTIPITAPNTPGTIKTEITGLTMGIKVTVASLGNLVLPIALDCTASGVLGQATVIAPPPPPPGAPDAVNDNATTNLGEAVTVDVLANDVPDSEFPIDLDSLAITEPPTKGTAVINEDDTITYTPDGETGVDSFKYQLCSLIEDPQVEVDEAPCDVATVSITINDPTPVTTTTTPGTVAPASTAAPTTATVAPAAELPRTGSSTLPLSLIGGGLLVLGLSALGLLRRRGTIG
ncbi:MAG TPA: Ig-like domain-containing protein [Acidimicrobiia bacterium]|nr:Ig-like domain-containing protein [Acidimicrobiia bacterium]